MASASDVAALLTNLRQADGGFGPSAAAASEPEPTALAALALDDADARAWLLDQQRDDGSWLVGPASVGNDAATAWAALALDGDPRERALDYLVAHRAVQAGADDRVPHDIATRGWSWTPKIFGWVEPTARATLVLKLLRPAASAEIADGVAVLADRECVGGGWNYGNRRVLDVDLPPFLQTSAAGLMAVHDGPPTFASAAWPRSSGCGWTRRAGSAGRWASSRCASPGRTPRRAPTDLSRLVDDTDLLGDSVALAWATLALGDGWRRLRVGA